MDEWFPEVFKTQRENQKNVYEFINNTEDFEIPIYPSNGNFVFIEINDPEITPEAISTCYAEHKILVRQGNYHTKKFGNKFIKVMPDLILWNPSFLLLLTLRNKLIFAGIFI